MPMSANISVSEQFYSPSERVMEKQYDNKILKGLLNLWSSILLSLDSLVDLNFYGEVKKNNKAYTAKWNERTLTELKQYNTMIRNWWAEAYISATYWSVFIPPDISINSATLLLRSCRRSIASSQGWHRPQAHTVGFSWKTHLVHIL